VVDVDTVDATHRAWLSRRPEMLDAALERVAPLLALLAPANSAGDGAT